MSSEHIPQESCGNISLNLDMDLHGCSNCSGSKAAGSCSSNGSSESEVIRLVAATLNSHQKSSLTSLPTNCCCSSNSSDQQQQWRDSFLHSLVSEIHDEATLHSLARLAEQRLSRLRRSGDCGEPLSLLPRHIALRVLSHLDPVSLCRCLRVSRHWSQLASEPSLWKVLCCSTAANAHYRPCSSVVEREQQQRYTDVDGTTIYWRGMFSERYRLRSNWLAGRCVIRTFTGHDQGVSCVQFDAQRIVSGSSDSDIRIWDLTNGEGEGGGVGQMTLTGHSATVRCLHLNGSKLASGSNDFSIKIWELAVRPTWSHIACRRTLLGHVNTVRCLQMEDSSLVSGSYDTTLKLWSLESGACHRTLQGHSDAVLCLQYFPSSQQHSHRLLSGSADQSIRVWDERVGNNGEEANVLTIHNAHESAVTCLRYCDDGSERIVSGSVDRTLKMWDVRTGRCLHTIDWKAAEGHTGVVRCLQTDAWRIVSAADDRTIKVWKLDSGERICTLHGHTDGVTCVQFNDHRIVSGSYDRTVKLWDFSAC